MGERLARRRAPDVLVHAAVPKTGSMTLIAHLNNASALSKVYNGTTELLGEFACRRTDAFLARLARAKASGKLAYAPGHVALAAIKRCVPPHLDAAYLFALRDPIHTAHSAASFYPLVYDELADAGPEWITASILGGDAHVAALTLPVEKHVACADAFGGGDDCHLEYARNAVTFARSRSGACATTLGEFAYARRDRLEAAKSALASLDAFVVMEDAGDAGDVLACLVGARLQSLDGDRRNPTARPVGIDAARRALYENATRLDAELYSFAREAHAHLAATVRARLAARRQRHALLRRLSSWCRRTGAWRPVLACARARYSAAAGSRSVVPRSSGATRAWTRGTASRASAGKWRRRSPQQYMRCPTRVPSKLLPTAWRAALVARTSAI